MKKIIVFFSILLSPIFLWAQNDITGPTCVKAGFEYQYLIRFKGKFKDKSQVCVKGGNLVNSKTECTLIDSFAAIKVIWDAKVTRGNISFSSSKGNAGFEVTVIAELDPGTISGRKTQLIEYDAKREQIDCSPATGGSCSPVYEYQWESSEDAVEWKEMKGETKISLQNQPMQKKPMFYRRRVTEKTSGLIAYSDIASVYLNSISL